ncbi:MocR-like pyridoxine biosynthesis transcription factor PdxR [Vibrio ulleungensis]|uniref:PLP-dependent aminotransferase family protein n=1 Tax=Vibrio ulleungensis TaxID=2807619 RepID=A0ABS2HJ38_9VIBR|nr:PLP-dependent aminotransferase family protein [Vibrio ulleungensis]MBM7037044.1 PLP-dependent aminotransferase family protein [Vibrio ulleungensis]
MALIDIGDLCITEASVSKQEGLQRAIRIKIVKGLWVRGGKLPSTRKMAEAMKLSRNTVIYAYEQLVAEGYIESRQGSGFYVVPKLPDHYLQVSGTQAKRPNVQTKIIDKPLPDLNRPFSPGVPDLAQFPHTKWQRFVSRHSASNNLMGAQPIEGSLALRRAIADYLRASRSVHCSASDIIITQGAQQALTISLMATMNNQDDQVGIEQPGYTQLRKIISLLGYQSQAFPVRPATGLDFDRVTASAVKTLYITPSNQYPLGTTLNTEQRLELIAWAKQHQSWIIEDDYDSEFQFTHQPYPSLQGLADTLGEPSRVLYVGSFSKIMFNGLRLGYMVVPKTLYDRCLMIKEALTGNTPSHTQAALADFIAEGELLRHIRKMRRVYNEKYQRLALSLHTYFGDDIEVISQAAGLHVTLRWYGQLSEQTWAERALNKNIVIRPMTYYETAQAPARDWQGAVLGFGNIALDSIDEAVSVLAECFYSKDAHK